MAPARGLCITLHRAVANAGDFLIRDRMIRLLAEHRPDLQLKQGRAWLPLARQFSGPELAAARAIVVCGGPGYQRGMYPRVYPLELLDRLPAPVFLAALGTYALRDPSKEVEPLDSATIDFLKWVEAHGGRLGARDDMTARMLAGMGFASALMTGDPGWYDTEWLARNEFRADRSGVAFTPPANPLFHPQGLAVLDGLAQRYGATNVVTLYHRGIQPTFEKASERLGARTMDISGSASGLSLLDDVGLHVGYRVHAHLYSLSHATPSYLVAEDSRGLGVLETLNGLGIDGIGDTRATALRRLWKVMPRLGSARSEISRSLGLAIGRLVSLPVVGELLLEAVEADRSHGFDRHVAAKERIRLTYPTMVEMLKAIP
jgi:hypothetical protein